MSPLRLLSIAILALTAASLPAQKQPEPALVEGDGDGARSSTARTSPAG